MCPVCWASALLYFGGFFAVSIASVAGNDKLTLAGAAALGTFALLDHLGLSIPWWLILALLIVVGSRLVYLLFCRWNECLLAKAWHLARQLAKRSCPNKRRATEVVAKTA